MVYIASWWNEQSPLDVRVFSNASEVELFLNGVSLGRQKPDTTANTQNLNHPPFTFNLKNFEKGELLAKAYIDGKEVATHSVKTPEAPAKYEVVVDESRRVPRAGVNDVVFVYARLVDANGTVVPMNDVKVDFKMEGGGSIVNPEAITTEAGIATALVKIGQTPSSIQIQVSDTENRTGALQFNSK
jgi:beta-galactosidase